MIIVNHLIRKQHLSIVQSLQSVPRYLFVKILLSKTWRLIVPVSEYEKKKKKMLHKMNRVLLT